LGGTGSQSLFHLFEKVPDKNLVFFIEKPEMIRRQKQLFPANF
jgi:hypothetical protein